MSNIRMENGGIDPAQNAPQQETFTNLTSDVGEVLSSSTLNRSDNTLQPKINQKMPQNALTDYMTRYTEIQTIAISGTSPAQFASVTISPWRSFLLNSFIADKVANYQFIRGTIEVLLVPAFPANGYGAYAITAYPVGSTGDISSTVSPQATTAFQTDNYALVDVSACENTVMQLPFLWPYDYADISTLTASSTDAMWDMRLWTLSTLKTSIPGGVTVGTIRVFVRLLPDYELVVPTLQGKRGKSMVGDKTITGMTGAADLVSGGKFKGAVSGMADKISGVASMLSNVPVIGPYAGVASKVADTVGDVASWFGFTREDAERVPLAVVQRPISCAAHIDGEDTSESATLSTANSISIDPLINGVSPSEDQMAFSSLFARWTLIQSFTWAPTQVTGTILGSFPISPMYAKGVSTDSLAELQMTVAGYCGIPFKFWRGDMEYLILIPVSKLHRGTLQIYWVPVGSATTATPTVSTLNVIYDVAADEEKQLVVGYARDAPYSYCVVMSSDAPIITTGATNGRLVFNVVNPLQSQNAASSVDVLIFARAKGNMNFQVLTNEIMVSTSAGLFSTPIQADSFTYQGASGDEDQEENHVVALVPETGDYPAAEINFGEIVSSARTMMQKFTWVVRVPAATTLFRHLPYNMPSDPSCLTYDGHYARMFHGIACGTRYKLIPSDMSKTILSSAHLLTPNFLGDLPLGNDNLLPTQSCVSGGAEFRLPYYSNKKYLTMQQPQDVVLWDYVSAIDTAGDEVARRICRACAPDIRITCFSFAPRVIITFEAEAINPWI